MGDLLQFPLQRARSGAARAPIPPAFFFDVRSPLSYLTAERVERRLPEAEWIPVDGAALAPPPAGAQPAGERLSGEQLAGEHEPSRVRALAEAHARALRLPLVWPDEFPVRTPCVQRAAAFACELGAGAAFALAAGRLAFCGGFALDDPEAIAEAAAAAGVPLGPCLEAAGESWRDEELGELSATLRSAGIDRLPAFRVGSRWLQGDESLRIAAALAARGACAQGPLAPVG